MNLLTVKNLKKIYGSKWGGSICHALNGIDFEVAAGEFVGVMGPSGAGKTTLLNIIATIDTPTSGSVRIDGTEITSLNETGLSDFRRTSLGFIFQDFNLLDTLTVQENIILPLSLAKVKARACATEIEARLEQVSVILGIRDILAKYPYEISGGQKQRTAAARAIITKPKLILADEPTGALDSKSSLELLQALSEINTENQATILMVTHDAFAASFCRRIIFIKDGLLFAELLRGDGRKEFFDKILSVLAALGGDNRELF